MYNVIIMRKLHFWYLLQNLDSNLQPSVNADGKVLKVIGLTPTLAAGYKVLYNKCQSAVMLCGPQMLNHS